MLSVPRLLQIPLLTILILALILGAGALYTYFGARAIERAHPPSGRVITVDGVRLHVLDEGTPKPGEPPLVLIHGASDNLEDWRVALGDRLRDRRVILIDRPGLGWSDGPGVDATVVYTWLGHAARHLAFGQGGEHPLQYGLIFLAVAATAVFLPRFIMRWRERAKSRAS